MLRRPRRVWDELDTAERVRLEAHILDVYARCRPGDTFDDLKRRARLSKGDARLLRDWLKVARRRAAAEISPVESERQEIAA